MVEKTPAEINTQSPFSLIIKTIAIIIGLLIMWKAITVFLLAFASILIAIFLSTMSSWISRKVNLNYHLSLALVVLGILGLLTLFFWISAPLIAKQLNELVLQIPEALEKAKEKISSNIDLKSFSMGSWTGELFKNKQFYQEASAIFSFTFATITGFIFFIILGIYLATNPHLYINGFLELFSKSRKRVENIIYNIGHSLQWWLMGKCISMITIGILSTLGLWILNVPLAFILGLLAALLAFIPYIGSIIASIPAILIGFSISPWTGLYVTILYILIHALEGYFITPFIEQRTVYLPPALTIFVQIILSLLIGFLGLALASPITVLMIGFTKELFVKKRTST